MKRSGFLVLFSAFVAVSLVFGVLPGKSWSASCPDLGYWRLDEQSQPYKDNIFGENATCTNCPSPGTGIVNGAQTFTAGSQVSVPYVSDMDYIFGFGATDSFSLEAWVKADPGNLCTNVQSFLGRVEDWDHLQWYIGCAQGGSSLFVLHDALGKGGEVDGTAKINDGNWHQVVGVRDASANQILLYVDGKPDGSAPITLSSNFKSSTNLTLGWLSYGSDGNHWLGALDEVAVFGNALSAGDVAAQYSKITTSHVGYCDNAPVSTDNPPTAPVLVSPIDNATGVDTSVTFQWNHSTDPEGEAISYDLYYCDNPNPQACAAIANAGAGAKAASLEKKDSVFAGLGGYGAGLLLFGFVLAGGTRRRKKLWALVAILVFSGMFLISCGGGGSGSSSTPPASGLSQDVTGLKNGTTYSWQVVAKDSKGNSTPSKVRTFKTK